MKDLKNLIPILCSLFSMIILCVLIYLNKDFKVFMKDEVINVGDRYEDYFTATFRGYDVTRDVKIISNVYDTKLGTYQLTFTYLDGRKEYAVTKNIEIKDLVPPVILLRGGDEDFVKVGSNYIEKGYTANDNYDSNLSDKVVISGNVNTNVSGTYELVYSVTDSNNNKASKKRIVHVMEKLPYEMSESEFSLEGLFSSTILKEKKAISDKTMKLYTFIGDKDIALYSTYGLMNINNLWYNTNLDINNVELTPIIIDGFNTDKPLYDNVVVNKPKAIVLSFGYNNGDITEYVRKYTELVTNLKSRTDSRIIVTSVNTVSSKNNISIRNINSVNYYLAKMCNENGVYFAYTNEALTRAEDNFLSDGKTLSKKGMTNIYNYLKTHIGKGD